MMTDPTGRFERKKEVLTSRGRMSSFSGYDKELGLEVTWHETSLLPYTKYEINTIIEKLEQYKKLKHPNILTLITYWISDDSSIVYYITEAIYSDSIWERIVNNQITPRPRIVAKWALAILQALEYLHSQKIVHGSIRLECVYTKPSTGQVKLIPPMFQPLHSVNLHNKVKLRYNTPPEVFTASENTRGDIWMFGLLLLQAFTQQIPYAECTNPYSLYSAIKGYKPPAIISYVTDNLLQDLVLQCLKPPELRPGSTELLQHSFFTQHFEVHNTPLGAGGNGVSLLIANRNLSTEVLIPGYRENRETASSPIVRQELIH